MQPEDRAGLTVQERNCSTDFKAQKNMEMFDFQQFHLRPTCQPMHTSADKQTLLCAAKLQFSSDTYLKVFVFTKYKNVLVMCFTAAANPGVCLVRVKGHNLQHPSIVLRGFPLPVRQGHKCPLCFPFLSINGV